MVRDTLDRYADEIDQHMMDERWFEEWSDSTCRFQGFNPGTSGYEECRREQI